MCRTSCHSCNRRHCLATAAALTLGGGWLVPRAAGAPRDERLHSAAACPQCGGTGRVPVKDAQPWVWIEGSPLPPSPEAAGVRACPTCQMSALTEKIGDEFAQQAEGALANHRRWEERTGWSLTCVVTRHAALHTQFTAGQAKAVGTAIENLTLHLKRLTGSLALTPGRPDRYEQVLLWEEPAWSHFRQTMEQLYSPTQLGEAWRSAKQLNSYDHFVTQHLYETPQTVRGRPVTCGPVFLAARRQLALATDRQAPLWLSEGFSAYGDHVIHKQNRWYMLYDQDQAPTAGNWLAEARQLAVRRQLRPWPQVFARELRDWQPADYVQTLGMTAFLLERSPAKFVELVARLSRGEPDSKALESAWQQPVDELEKRCARWLQSRK